MLKPLVVAALAVLALAAMAAPPDVASHGVSIPARGLFEGERLSAAARQRLADLVVDALGLQVEVALIVPAGPWRIDGSGSDERDLTPARLAAVRSFLAERGLDPKHVFVESRIDASAREPRLDVQVLGRRRPD